MLIGRTQFTGRTFACECVVDPARNACLREVSSSVFASTSSTHSAYSDSSSSPSITLATLVLQFAHVGGGQHASADTTAIKEKATARESEAIPQSEGVDVKIDHLGPTVSSRSLLRRGQDSGEKVILTDVDTPLPRGKVSKLLGPSGVRCCSFHLAKTLAGVQLTTHSRQDLPPPALRRSALIRPHIQLLHHRLRPSQQPASRPSHRFRETLHYAARLRLRGKTKAQCEARTEVLRMLELKLCAENVVVG